MSEARQAAAEPARGLVLRVISPTVVTGAGIAVAATSLTAERVDAAGVAHPLEVRPAEPPEGDAPSADGGGTAGGQVTGSESVTAFSQNTGQSVTSGLDTTIGPTTDGTGQAGDSTGHQGGGGPEALGDDILVEFVQHIVVHELPDGQFSVESVITIVVHRDGQEQVFEQREQQTVAKEHADTDLVIQQDGDVLIRLDDQGNVTVVMDGDLTVTEQPGDPYDDVPEGAVVVVQDQDLTVIDEDDGIDDDVEDPDVYGHFEQTADADDDPGDGEVDVFVVDQSQTKTETEVDTTPYGTRTTQTPQPAPAPVATPEVMVHATAQTYAATPGGIDPAFGAATGVLPDPTGFLDTPFTPVVRDALGREPSPDAGPAAAAETGTGGHFEPADEPPLDSADAPDPVTDLDPAELDPTDLDPAGTAPSTDPPLDGQPADGLPAFGSDAHSSASDDPDQAGSFDPQPSTLDPAQL